MDTSYELHSALSPEELNRKLRMLVRTHNSLHGKECPIRLKWKSENEFTISQTDISADFGVWRADGKTSRSLFWRTAYGSGKVWSFQDPFRGVILLDGAGGSVVCIRTVPWTGRIITVFGAVLACAGMWISMSSDSWEPLLIVMFCFALFAVPVLKSGKIENNLALLALLEEKLSSPPPEKE